VEEPRRSRRAAGRQVGRLRTQWIPPTPEKEKITLPEGPGARRTRARHFAVHALMDRGVNHSGIVAELRLDPRTVRRFMRAATPEELIGANPTGRQSSLDGHGAYLIARFNEGCTSGDRLHEELAERGLTVSKRTVRRFLQRLKENTEPTARPPIPKVREVTTLILTHPDNRPESDRVILKELRDRCEDLNTVCELVARFAEILVNLRGREKLDQWTADAEASDLPNCADSPPDCARTGTPSWPASACTGTPAPSRDTSTGSRC
jgi:transposase